tara:strand:+ start:1467 stop:2186 length:720 start_codon:yes stop_codon:yes gene_type:complete
MADKPDQNWEARDIDSRGSKFRIDVNNPQEGTDGPNAYIMYGVTENKDRQFSALSESGTYRLHNEKSMEIVAGSKNSKSDQTIKLISANGNITISVLENGQVKIRGSSVVIQADDDINLTAGRNVTIKAGQRILLKALKADASALVGNLVHSIGSWIERIYAPTQVGTDYLRNPPTDDKILKDPVVPGVGDVADAADASKLPLKERIQKRMKQIKENIAKQKDRIVNKWTKWRENRGDI